MENIPQQITTLTLNRRKQMMEAGIPINIYVNGYLAYQLKNGESKTIKIFTGDEIQLQAAMMKNKTGILLVSRKEREENFYEISHIISNSIYLSGVILAILSTILVFATNQIGFMTLVAPPAFFLLYYKFIKKDKYLKILSVPKEETKLKPSEN